jgi:Leucine-rich repeat (LRR) protein
MYSFQGFDEKGLATTDPKRMIGVKARVTETLPIIMFLSKYPAITYLELTCSPISDISWLKQFPQITHLCISYTYVRDISALSHLTSLKELVMNELNIDTLKPLVGLQRLKALYLLYSRVRDISSIKGLSPDTHITMPTAFGGDVSCLKEMNKLYIFTPCFYTMDGGRDVLFTSKSMMCTGQDVAALVSRATRYIR